MAGLASHLGVRSDVTCTVHRADGTAEAVALTVRLDTQEDVEYWRHGGILPRVWRSYVTGEPMREAAESLALVQPEPGGPMHELPDALPASDVPSVAQGVSLT